MPLTSMHSLRSAARAPSFSALCESIGAVLPSAARNPRPGDGPSPGRGFLAALGRTAPMLSQSALNDGARAAERRLCMEVKGILLAFPYVAPEYTEAYNRWYDLDHL